MSEGIRNDETRIDEERTEEPARFSIPRIRTRRLLLREFRKSDFDDYAANLADPVATEHLSGVVDRRTAWRMFGAGAGFWVLNGGGWWGVELRETGRLVGTVGAFFREHAPDELEIGWTVYRQFWRQGFATEAAAAALAYGFEAHDVKRAIALISPKNLASIGVSRAIGMQFDSEVDFYGERIGCYAKSR